MGPMCKASIAKLGILAGGGEMPQRLLAQCVQEGIPVHVIGFEGQGEEALSTQASSFQWAALGSLGHVIESLKKENVSHVVLIGSVKRPSFATLKPDLYTLKLLTKVGRSLLGDDGLLSFLVGQLETEGFTVLGIQDIYQGPRGLLPGGLLGKKSPPDELRKTIPDLIKKAIGFAATDIGQSLVVYNELVLGAEGIEGTDGLLRRCANIRDTVVGSSKGGILVKVAKPQQDKRVDLPTIGPQTITIMAQLGYEGIVAQASNVLVVDSDECQKRADEAGLFIVGIEA